MITKQQGKRLNEFLTEIEDIQHLCSEWTQHEYCAYLKSWVDKDNNYNGYIRQGGVRPHRPHNP